MLWYRLCPLPANQKKRNGFGGKKEKKREMVRISWNENENQTNTKHEKLLSIHMDIINHCNDWAMICIHITHTYHNYQYQYIEYHSLRKNIPSTNNNKQQQWKWHDPHHLLHYYYQRPRTLSKYNHRYGLGMMIFHRTRWMMLLLLFHRMRSIIILLPHNHIHPPWRLS